MLKLFNQLAGSSLPCSSELLTHVQKFTFTKGEFLFSQGEVIDSLFYIECGLVKLFYLNESGKDKTKTFISDHQLFASLNALVVDGKSSFTAFALENTTVNTIKFSHLFKLMDEHLEWERVARKIFQNLALQKERREYQLLVLSAEERYELFLNEYTHLVKRLPISEVAKFIGVTPVALSRIRGRKN